MKLCELLNGEGLELQNEKKAAALPGLTSSFPGTYNVFALLSLWNESHLGSQVSQLPSSQQCPEPLSSRWGSRPGTRPWQVFLAKSLLLLPEQTPSPGTAAAAGQAARSHRVSAGKTVGQEKNSILSTEKCSPQPLPLAN